MLPVIEHLRQPMAVGGMWLQPSDSGALPVYVTHEAHIQRLTFDGWRSVPDPRADRIAQLESEHARENEALKRRIAELEALTKKESFVALEPQDPIDATEPEPDDTKRKARRSKPE